MSRPQNISRYLDEGPCDCSVRVTEHDGQVHYVWLTGASGGFTPVAVGTQHDKGYQAEWRIPVSHIKTIRRIPTERYRRLSGWNGAL